MEYRLKIGGETFRVEVAPRGDGEDARFVIREREYRVSYRALSENAMRLVVDGKALETFVAAGEDGKHLFLKGRSFLVQDADAASARRGRRRGLDDTPGEVTPPMPAVVVRIMVREGDPVKKGQGLVVVTAMKMETTLTAPHDGRVSRINTSVDAKVAPGDILVRSRKRCLKMSEDLLYEVREGTAFVTLNREARRNAISPEMMNAFLDRLDSADRDEEVHALCLTGAGDKVFCSGADLAVTLSGQEHDPLGGAKKYAELLKKMARFGKPTVARVNGPCLAGGIGLMLSCDIVIAAEDVFFRTPEVNVGIFPMMVGALLYRNVGRKKALDMVLTGRKVFAREAEDMGLITRSVERDRLDREVREALEGLTSKSTLGMRLGKEAFRAMSDMPFDDAVDYLCEALGRAISIEDAREGMAAFLEKRKPEFKGR